MMLDPTTKVEKTTKNLSFFTINIYDFPGKYDFKDATPEDIQNIQKCGSVIYVVDVQVILFKFILLAKKFFSQQRTENNASL